MSFYRFLFKILGKRKIEVFNQFFIFLFPLCLNYYLETIPDQGPDPKKKVLNKIGLVPNLKERIRKEAKNEKKEKNQNHQKRKKQ